MKNSISGGVYSEGRPDRFSLGRTVEIDLEQVPSIGLHSLLDHYALSNNINGDTNMKFFQFGFLLLITFSIEQAASADTTGNEEETPSSSVDYERFSSSIKTLKKRVQMPSGLAVAVVDGKRVLYQGNFGFSNISKQLPVTDKTHFYIASTTKSFLALATLLAEERGDLSESTSLARLFPSYKFENFDATQVKVRDLLSHTSGIDNPHFTWAGSWTGQHTSALRERFVQTLAADPTSKYGEHKYSNIGYNIISVWFEHQYQRDWRDILDEWVLKPLDMGHTTGYISKMSARNLEFAEPYSYKYRKGKEPIYLRKNDQTMYSIGLISTVEDLTKFLRAQLAEGNVDGKQVFPKKVIETSHQPLVDANSYYESYARGWQIGKFDKYREIFHTGGFPGTSVLISFVPEKDIGVIVLQNESGLKANLVANYVKNYIYQSHLTKTPNQIDTWVKEQVDAISARALSAQEEEVKEQQKIENVPIDLSQHTDHYIGVFLHPLAGRIEVFNQNDKKIMLRWGSLYGETFGLEEIDHLNFNLRPGEYIPVKFLVENGNVEGLVINSFTFTKQNNDKE